MTGCKTACRDGVNRPLQRIYGAAPWQLDLGSWHVRRFLSYRFTTCRDRVLATVQRSTDDSLTGTFPPGDSLSTRPKGFQPATSGCGPVGAADNGRAESSGEGSGAYDAQARRVVQPRVRARFVRGSHGRRHARPP